MCDKIKWGDIMYTEKFSIRILVTLVGMLAAVGLVIGVFNYSIMKDSSNELVLDNLEDLTDATYNLVDSNVNTSIENYLRSKTETVYEILQYYYKEYQEGNLNEQEAKTAFEQQVMEMRIGSTGYIYVLNSNADLIIHPSAKGTNISNYYFANFQVNNKNGYLSYTWKNPGEIGAREKVLYMLYFEEWDYIISASSYKDEFIELVNVEEIREKVLSITIGDSGYMHIMDSNGVLVVHPDQEGTSIIDHIDSSGKYVIREIIETKNGSITYPWKNSTDEKAREKIVFYRYYKELDWYLCSGVYLDEISNPFEDLGVKLVIMTTILLSIAFIISYRISKYITKPINRLIEGATKVSAGDFTAEISSDRRDEIGHLTHIFNLMLKRIKEIMSELDISNLELVRSKESMEYEIDQRTKKLQELAERDPLTNLNNRRSLEKHLDHLMSTPKMSGSKLSVLMLDIDFFKKYNDRYGHQEGDVCLKKVASLIQKQVRHKNDYVARYGGEEFIVVMMNADEIVAGKLAKRILLKIISEKIENKDSEISEYLTLSIGITTCDCSDEQDISELIKKADKALYIAKDKGRNRVEFLK